DDGGHHARQEHHQSDQKDKLERIIRDGESGEFNGDRSRAVWWVINEMLRHNCPTSTSVSTLLNRDNKISAHVYDQPNPPQYAERQVAQAKKEFDAKSKSLPESQWLGEKPVTP